MKKNETNYLAKEIIKSLEKNDVNDFMDNIVLLYLKSQILDNDNQKLRKSVSEIINCCSDIKSDKIMDDKKDASYYIDLLTFYKNKGEEALREQLNNYNKNDFEMLLKKNAELNLYIKIDKKNQDKEQIIESFINGIVNFFKPQVM